MKTQGIRGRTAKRFVRATDSRHDWPVAANVPDRDFPPAGPNEPWCADPTDLPTPEGWLDLAVVEDLFSRRYASGHHQGVLTQPGIACRTSGVAQCWDNAPMESFFASLKRERDFPASCTRDDARAIVFEYIELFYNPVRLHSSLGYLSPAEYERRYNPTLR